VGRGAAAGATAADGQIVRISCLMKTAHQTSKRTTIARVEAKRGMLAGTR
jgi:hypothetical protein